MHLLTHVFIARGPTTSKSDAPARTMETINENHPKWQQERGRESTHKQCYNYKCSSEPLLTGPRDANTPVLKYLMLNY